MLKNGYLEQILRWPSHFRVCACRAKDYNV